MTEDQALLALLKKLGALEYRFVTTTPISHARVVARPPKQRAASLADVFGWNVPFAPELLPDDLLAALREGGMLIEQSGACKSGIRVSSVRDRLFLHAAFPTDAVDAVFLGPDSYRFATLIADEIARVPLGPGARIIDVGTGAGVGAIVAADCCPDARIVATDVNRQALRFAAINAATAGVSLDLHEADGLAGIEGRFDLILLNPPYIIDPEERTYRHGGAMHGARLSLDLALQGLDQLTPGGRLILYTGSAIIDGEDALHAALAEAAAERGLTLRYREIDPDVFGEELDTPPYTEVDRIALIAACSPRSPRLGGWRQGDEHVFARAAGEAGEHRVDQVRHDMRQAVVERACAGTAFEQHLPICRAADTHVEIADEIGVAAHVVIAVALIPEGIVPAIGPATAAETAPAEAAIAPRAEPAIAAIPPEAGAEAGRGDDLLMTVVDAVIEADDQGCAARAGCGLVALLGQARGHEARILREFEAALHRGVFGLDVEALALRRGEHLKARDVRAERLRDAASRGGERGGRLR